MTTEVKCTRVERPYVPCSIYECKYTATRRFVAGDHFAYSCEDATHIAETRTSLEDLLPKVHNFPLGRLYELAPTRVERYECDSGYLCRSVRVHWSDKTEPVFDPSDLYWTGRNWLCMTCYVEVADQSYELVSLGTLIKQWNEESLFHEMDDAFECG